MIGRTLGHYRILEKIGEGGMGVVYRARDERLERDVALKVLPAGMLADEAARKRFRKEALALSRLNHPNIATVHDFDTQEGVDFLVLEYIPGATLDERLKEGPLPEKEVLRLGAQLAEGLAAAHEQGVMHRDLKPGNLRVTPDGRLKILDFGLAALRQPESDAATTASSLSESQLGAGTLPYMAPEQLGGGKADARTDIYAAGAVLYEMATGQRPFPATRGPLLINAILNEAPAAPRAVHSRVSGPLDNIILKSLDKEPNRRYQSARELLVDLERLRAPSVALPLARPRAPARRWLLVLGLTAGPVLVGVLVYALWLRDATRSRPFEIKSLAVLPLENLSRDPEQEYFADGMTEALISDLAQISALRVISRTSIMRYKGARKPLPEIARELNVDAVVEGSVQRSGDRVRITAQLVHAPTDRHLWARSYDRGVHDVLVLQAEVARAIAQEIRVHLTAQQTARLAAARPVNPQAHEAYLKGDFYWNKFTPDDWKKAMDFFQQAIDADPAYAPGYAGLGRCFGVMGANGVLPPKEAFPRVKDLAGKALALDPLLPEALTELGAVHLFFDRDWPAAEGAFRRAIELSPNHAHGHNLYSYHLLATGRREQAIEEAKRALELDPLSPLLGSDLGITYCIIGQYEQGIAQFRKTLEMHTNTPFVHWPLGDCLIMQGKYEEGIAQIRKALESFGDARPPRILAALGYAYGRAGKRAEARKVLADLEKLGKSQYMSPFFVAQVYVGLGEKDQAFQWLERAYDEPSGWLMFLKQEPMFESLRSDPRFTELVKRLRL